MNDIDNEEINDIENRKTIEFMSQSWFLEKVNETDKPLARLSNDLVSIIAHNLSFILA